MVLISIFVCCLFLLILFIRNKHNKQVKLKQAFDDLDFRLNRLAVIKWGRSQSGHTNTCGQCRGFGHYCSSPCGECNHGMIEGIGGRVIFCDVCGGNGCTCITRGWKCVRCGGSGRGLACEPCKNTGYLDFPVCDSPCGCIIK